MFDYLRIHILLNILLNKSKYLYNIMFFYEMFMNMKNIVNTNIIYKNQLEN